MRLNGLLRSVIVFVILAGFVPALGLAQSRRHDLSLSYGVVSADQVADVLADVLTIVILLGTFHKDDMQYTGVPCFSYHYARNSRFGFGFAVGGYRSSGDLEFLDEVVGDFRETNTFGALEIDYRWVMKKGFQLYSGAGVGVRFRKGTYNASDSTETDTKALPTFHLNVIGFRIGGKIGVFGELGAGYKGLFCGGLSAQF